MANPDPEVATDLHERPVDILRELIQFETVNPPGNEGPCIDWIAQVFDAYGIEYDIYAHDPERPNLIARLEGGNDPPLLLYGHVDVVPVADQEWTHDPFEAVVDDGMVWGRGALDMKSGVAMFLATFLKRAAAEEELAGDLVFLAVSDEEDGGTLGLEFLVQEHPELFSDIEIALGEFGGFPMAVGDQTFYPIQVNEKQVCWLEATFRGNSGHASLPTEDTAMGELGRFLASLEETRLPVHLTPTTRSMIEALAAGIDDPEAAARLSDLLDPDRTNEVLDSLPFDARILDAVTHNTASPTVLECEDKVNVVPEEVRLTLDCRLLPGQSPDDVIDELQVATDGDPSFDVLRFDAGPPPASSDAFDTLAAVLEDATGKPAIPFLLFAATDGRHLAQVGVQSYGFTPLALDDIPLLDIVHSGDERVPTDAVEWGTERVNEAIDRYWS